MEVALDTRIRPAAPLRLEVEPVLDASRGAVFAGQLEGFRGCLDEYRAARGNAGGRFSVMGYIRPDGSFADGSVVGSAYSEGFERCASKVAATLTWPATDLETVVGFHAVVIVHDRSRRADDEVRAVECDGTRSAPWSGAPRIAWSSLELDAPQVRPVIDHLQRLNAPLSDCLWHAWPTSEAQAVAVLDIRIAAGGGLRGTVRGEDGPVAPELVECLGRSLSVIPSPEGPIGGGFTVRLQVGRAGVGGLSDR
jgi:hypothetical protein